LPRYNFIASDREGQIKRGFLESSSQDAVIDYLENHNLIPISIKERKKKAQIAWPWNKKVSLFDKIIFIDHLGAMLAAGVPLARAMEILIEDTENKYFKEILEETKFSLEKGETISKSFVRYPIFSDVEIGLIKAGEKSGRLSQTLHYISIQLKRERSLYSMIKSATIYPAILFSGTFLVIFLLLTFVLPKIIAIFHEAQISVPLPTRILLFIASLLSGRLYITFPVLALLIVGIWWGIRSPTGKKFFKNVGLKIPLVADLLRKIELARMTRTMASLIAAGVPIIETVEITRKVLVGTQYEQQVEGFLPELKRGVSLSSILKKRRKYFPNLLMAMVDVGETTGTLSKVLLKLARFYEEETNVALKRVVSVVEPILLLIVGLFVAGIALSIVLPVYRLIGQFTQY